MTPRSDTQRMTKDSWWVRFRANEIAQLGLLSIAVFVLVMALIERIPFDMDEFLPYHSIACGNLAQQLNVYEGACGGYPTSFFGLEFERAFNYIGASSGWLMAPVFAVWSSLWAHSLIGVVFLLLSAVGIVTSIRLPWKFLPALLLYFPIDFAVIHDTGPIRISFLVMAWSPVVLRHFMLTESWVRKTLLVIGLSAAWMLANENKPYFIFLVPGIIMWSVACLMSTGLISELRRKWLQVTVFLGLASAMCISILFILRVEGASYFQYLTGFHSPIKYLQNVGTGATFIFDWPFSGHRIMYLYPNVDERFPALLQSPINALPWSADRGGLLAMTLLIASVVIVLGLYAWVAHRFWTVGPRLTLYVMLGAAIMLLIGAVLGSGGSNHHYVFAHVPIAALCLLAFAQLKQGAVRGALVLFAAAFISLFAVLAVPAKPSVSAAMDTVMVEAITRGNANTIINCASWGCYHQYTLLNLRDIPIVFAEKPEQQLALFEVARKRGAAIEHVCLDCDLTSLAQGYPGARIELVGEPRNGWSLFDIRY